MLFATVARHDADRARRRYQRALRKATAQLARARRRTPGAARPIASVDIALALRRAERRRAAEEAIRQEGEARRAATRATRVARLARVRQRLVASARLPVGRAVPYAAPRPRWLAALATSLAGHRSIG